jgi:hypothetical protein
MAGMAPEGWNKPWPLGVLLFGLIMLALAVIGTFTGKAFYRGTVERAKDSSGYWQTLVSEYLCGVALIWYYFYALAP